MNWYNTVKYRYLLQYLLNFMGRKFRGRSSLSMCFTELKLFRISAPKFPETFRKSTVENVCFF